MTRYIDQKKFPAVLATSGLQLPRVLQEARGNVARVLGHADLVKFREAAFKRDGFTPNGLSVPEARKIVDSLTANWQSPPQLYIRANYLELPVRAYPDTRGLYRPGEAWIVAGAHADEPGKPVRQAIGKTLAHEAIAHFGLRKMLGEDGWNTLMRNIQLALKTGNEPLNAIKDEGRAS